MPRAEIGSERHQKFDWWQFGISFFSSCSFVSSKAVAVTCCQIDSIIISPKCYIPCHLNISPISLLFYSNVSKWLKIGLMTLFDCWSNWFRRKICQNPIWSYNVNLKLGDSDWMDVDFVRTFYELCSYQIHRIIQFDWFSHYFLNNNSLKLLFGENQIQFYSLQLTVERGRSKHKKIPQVVSFIEDQTNH